MAARFLKTRHLPSDCLARLETIADGAPPLPFVTAAAGSERTRLLGRVDGGGFRGACYEGVPDAESGGAARLMRGLLGFRAAVIAVRVRILDADRGSLVRVSSHQPIGDSIVVGVLLGISLAVMRGSALEATAALPISLGIYLFMPLVRRAAFARAEAEVMKRVTKALEAKPLQ